MALEISPEPTEDERKAIVSALELEEDEAAPPTPWRAAALDSGGSAPPPEAWGDPRVVEPRDPRQHDGDE
jgi:hypothetical protein